MNTTSSKRKPFSLRGQVKVAFLEKQRDIAITKGFHQFTRSPSLSSDLVSKFFGYTDLEMIQEGNIVRLSVNN